jgi:alpha-tubulin suppressor-like RCC1 family protein
VNSSIPVQAKNLEGVTDVAAGGSHSLALKNDGTVWAWGSNSSGQLGNGTEVDSNIPVQVKNLEGIRAVAAGGSHSLALKMMERLWAWGSNSNGQLWRWYRCKKSVHRWQ